MKFNPLNNQQRKNVEFCNEIITDYLSSANRCDLTSFPIKTQGLECIYEKSLTFSEQLILYEKTREIPLVDDKTSIEKSTKTAFGIKSTKELSHTIATSKKRINREPRIDFVSDEVPADHSNHDLCDIDTGNFVNELFIQVPALKSQKLHVPNYISLPFASELFNNFCLGFPQETCKVFYATCDENSIAYRDFTKLSLKVYISLAFSNRTVFKALLFWSASFFQSKEKSVELSLLSKLKNDIIQDMNKRLIYKSSACCDHTIAIVFILFEVENLKQQVDSKFWLKLTGLAIKILSMRGGVDQLSKTECGFFFTKLFGTFFFTRFGFNLLNHEMQLFNIEDIQSIYILPAAANQNSYYKCMKSICSVVGESLHLYNLKKVAISADDLNESLGYIHYQNIETVIKDAKLLLKQLNSIDVPDDDSEIMRIDSHIMRLIAEFSKETTVLLIYQLIYNYSSKTTTTLLQVMKMIPLLRDLFELYHSNQNSTQVLLILPIFVLGCNLSKESYRRWFIENIERIYLKTKIAKILTVKTLVEKVWTMDDNGNKPVQWPEISEHEGLLLPFYI
ncbi:hypothetical protein JA9_004956 [Meyerozyma sp. JA9]|nr:hypothetical protein JA9_004956 [Meyerozyma sp. JA9]